MSENAHLDAKTAYQKLVREYSTAVQGQPMRYKCDGCNNLHALDDNLMPPETFSCPVCGTVNNLNKSRQHT